MLDVRLKVPAWVFAASRSWTISPNSQWGPGLSPGPTANYREYSVMSQP